MDLKRLFLAIFIIGISLILYVVVPIVAFELWIKSEDFKSQTLYDPVPFKNLSDSSVDEDGELILKREGAKLSDYKEFYLTAEKIGLKEVKVNVNSQDFDINLAHYPGTALPGEKGNIFISGHSATYLWPLQVRKNAHFSELMHIKKGDKIILTVREEKFEYEVIGIRVVNPEDLSVINPPEQDGRYLSLLTCVPPGLTTKRLVVLAKLL
jgi:LPXTG-site transpeptidase (sortase) family protein